MDVTFDFANETVKASWNEQTYGNGARYVHVVRGHQSSRGTYDANARIWTKRVGSPAYDAAIEAAFGWHKPEEERGKDGLTPAERAELEQFYIDQERNADESHARLVAQWKSTQAEIPLRHSYIVKPETMVATGATVYRVVFIDERGYHRPVDGQSSYATKQSAHRRKRQLNADLRARGIDIDYRS